MPLYQRDAYWGTTTKLPETKAPSLKQKQPVPNARRGNTRTNGDKTRAKTLYARKEDLARLPQRLTALQRAQIVLLENTSTRKAANYAWGSHASSENLPLLRNSRSTRTTCASCARRRSFRISLLKPDAKIAPRVRQRSETHLVVFSVPPGSSKPRICATFARLGNSKPLRIRLQRTKSALIAP